MSTAFDEVPADASGKPMLVAACDEDYRIYIEWLSDYLYRPGEVQEEPLSERNARIKLIAIEAQIAWAIWDDPHADYPPKDLLPGNGARHADVLHRKAISQVLSRVPIRAVRIKLLHSFYAELNRDAQK